MGATFDIEDQRALQAAFDAIANKALARATRTTLNRTATSVRSQISRRVRDTINLKASDIKDAVSIERARGSRVDRMKATVTIKDIPIPLEKYGARPRRIKTSRGIRTAASVKVKKSGSRRVIPGAFFAPLKFGSGLGLFGRRNKTDRRTKKLYGPSIRQLFKSKRFYKPILDFAAQQYRKEFEARYQEFLKQELGKVK